jgi:hypothetical protein
MNNQRNTDVLAWLALGIYAEIFPSVIMLVATLLARNGNLDPQDVRSFLSFSVLLSTSFAILIATVGDLLFEGCHPGLWPIITGIFAGSFLIGIIGVGAREAANFGGGNGRIGQADLISWFLFQIAISLLVLAYCAMIRSSMDSQSNV